MNFKFEHFLYLLIHFILGSFFILIGAYGIALPWVLFLQSAAVSFIIEHNLILSIFGLGFTLIGVSIIAYAFLQTRRRYVIIRTGKLGIVLDQNLIHQYLEAYWREHFQDPGISFQVKVKRRSIKILVDLPSMSLSEQKICLEKIKSDFTQLFGHQLGYPHEVNIIASFKS